MPLQPEAADLVSIGLDIHGRERYLTPEAAAGWMDLQAAAGRDGVTLQLVSAFRSLEYQRQIFERKLASGRPLEQILEVNAAPGYSEHHTGRAVDLTTPGCPPLEEEFETTAAFDWLVRQGGRFGFALTYPRGNRFGVAYEPWHWAIRVE
jgi:D-alanyl-D-alanine carboxypeptidase